MEKEKYEERKIKFLGLGNRHPFAASGNRHVRHYDPSMVSYRDIQANPVTVTATVFKYEEDTKTDADGGDKIVYVLYMSYTYEGEEYTTRYDTVRKEADARAALGKSVQIEINPDDPDSSSNEHSGYLLGFLPSIVFLGVGILFVSSQVKKS